jgi:uncharacterized repeat protein (TIGR01451 family)
MRKIARLGLVIVATLAAGAASAQQLIENFDSVVPNGWVVVNQSNPAGSTDWFQGNAGVFAAQGGAATSYAAANFNAAGDGGTISNWLITPQLTNLQNSEVLTFYTRTEALAPAADRMQVRLCIGDSTACQDVGATETDTGNFTSMLLDINPMLTTGAGGYPTSWTRETVPLLGLPPGANQGRLAFRYFVTNAGPGPTAVNSDYIGLDTLNLTNLTSVDLAISKTVDNSAPSVGDTVMFTVTITNIDTSPATNVAVSDVLPAGLMFVSATPSQGTYVSGTGIWTVGTLDPASPQTLVIQAKVLTPGPQGNTATISHSDQRDPNSRNNATNSPVNLSHPAPALGIPGMAVALSILGLVAFLALRRQ